MTSCRVHNPYRRAVCRDYGPYRRPSRLAGLHSSKSGPRVRANSLFLVILQFLLLAARVARLLLRVLLLSTNSKSKTVRVEVQSTNTNIFNKISLIL
jgi:hypothetical protein